MLFSNYSHSRIKFLKSKKNKYMPFSAEFSFLYCTATQLCHVGGIVKIPLICLIPPLEIIPNASFFFFFIFAIFLIFQVYSGNFIQHVTATDNLSFFHFFFFASWCTFCLFFRYVYVKFLLF